MHVQTIESEVLRTPLNTKKQALSKTAKLIHETLKELATKVANHRGYASSVTQVTLHLPVDCLAIALGVHRSTVYRNTQKLSEAGLVASRTHYCTHQAKTHATGTLWAIKLSGSKPAHVYHDDLESDHWRDLSSDIEAGRTAYADLHHTNLLLENKEEVINYLFNWTLKPQDLINPLSSVSDAFSLEAVLDVSYVAKEQRNEMVNVAAENVCRAFGDMTSINFYRYLMWQLLRLAEYHQKDYFYQVYMMLQRAQVDKQEGFAKSPGALFTSRLKQGYIWDEIRNMPPWRISIGESFNAN